MAGSPSWPRRLRSYYTELLASLPDLAIDIRHRHVAGDAIVLEVTIRGTHLGVWRGGLPATGRRVEFPLCGIFTFDAQDRLAGERIYYDRGTVMRQLGLFHEPEGTLGRLAIALSHPLTMWVTGTSADEQSLAFLVTALLLVPAGILLGGLLAYGALIFFSQVAQA